MNVSIDRHIQRVVDIMYEDVVLVENRDRLCLALGLTGSHLADIKRAVQLETLSTRGFFTMTLNLWAELDAPQANLENFATVLNEIDHNSTAAKIRKLSNQLAPGAVTSHHKPPERFEFGIHQYPKTWKFVGRQEDIQKLHDLLISRDAEGCTHSKILSGIPGSGKTAMAAHYSQKFQQDPYSNIVWINAETKHTIADSFARLADKLGIDIASKKFRELLLAIYKEFQERESLFVFDNVEELDQIWKFVPRSYPNSKIHVLLITSTSVPMSLNSVLRLQGFSAGESCELFKLELGDGINLDAASQVSELLQNHPLAINQAIKYIINNFQNDDGFNIDPYLQLCKEAVKKCPKWVPAEQQGVYCSLRIIMENIKKSNSLTENILDCISYFNADGIPVRLLYGIKIKILKVALKSQTVSAGTVHCAIKLMEKYGLVTLQFTKDESSNSNDSEFGTEPEVEVSISIQRTLQNIIRNVVQRRFQGHQVLKEAMTLIQAPISKLGCCKYRDECVRHVIHMFKHVHESSGLSYGAYLSFLDLIQREQSNLVEGI